MGRAEADSCPFDWLRVRNDKRGEWRRDTPHLEDDGAVLEMGHQDFMEWLAGHGVVDAGAVVRLGGDGLGLHGLLRGLLRDVLFGAALAGDEHFDALEKFDR